MVSRKPLIGIVDNDMGNLRSVRNAVLECGLDACDASTPEQLDTFSHLILPGVGNFGSAMHNLERNGMRTAIASFAASGRPLLGICLGMQLLGSTGEEGGSTSGLNLIPGRVRRFSSAIQLPVPHVGWNTVTREKGHPVLEGVKSERDFYFVHSYVFEPESPDHVIGHTTYGETFCTISARANVIGFQFHPEKSQKNGLLLIENFCTWDGRC